MKARVKATGEIVEVRSKVITSFSREHRLKYIDQDTGVSYFEEELFFPKDLVDDPDYWTRLEHQAAIAAMGGMCGNTSYDETTWEDMAEDAIRAAHALVGELKRLEERR